MSHRSVRWPVEPAIVAAALLLFPAGCDAPSSARAPAAAAQPAAETQPSLAVDRRSARSRYGELTVSGERGAPRLALDGRPILDGEAHTVDLLTLEAAQQIGAADVFLVQGTSGAACPATFFVVEISGPGKAKVTKPFGNCSDLATTRVEGGRWVIGMPTAQGGEARFIYAKGEVMESTETGALETAPAGRLTLAELKGAWLD